jgi:hypothetical protein
VGTIARWLQGLMVVVLAGSLLTLVVTVAVRGRIIDYLDDRGDLDDAESALGAVGSVTALTAAAQLAVVVLTMIWMFRLAKNHQLLGRVGSTWSPGWAIGGWFLPPCIFVIPWLMFQELWRGSTPGVPPGDPNWKRAPWGTLPTLWWVFYGLGSIVVGAASLRIQVGGADTEDAAKAFDRGFGLNIAGTFVNLVAGVIYIMLIRQLTARQQAVTGSA